MWNKDYAKIEQGSFQFCLTSELENIKKNLLNWFSPGLLNLPSAVSSAFPSEFYRNVHVQTHKEQNLLSGCTEKDLHLQLDCSLKRLFAL